MTFYYELSVVSDTHLLYLKDFIQEIYREALEEDGNQIILRDEEPLDDIEWGVHEFAKELSKHLNTDIHLETKQEKKENQDWIENYKKSINPITIEPFYIRASWHEADNNLQNIIIDPALAFGSGHHESTNACVTLLTQIGLQGKNLLDIGCGSGILSIVASKLGANISLCDTDELAVKESQKNLKLNGITAYEIKEGSIEQFNQTYDVITANISADILDALHTGIAKRVKPGGLLIASGIIEDKKDLVISRYKEFSIENIIQLNDWITILFKKDKNG